MRFKWPKWEWRCRAPQKEGLRTCDARKRSRCRNQAANTSQRLLERNPFLSYIGENSRTSDTMDLFFCQKGVDPYFKNDRLYADVLQRLSFFIDAGG